MAIFGYGRVSTGTQTTDNQRLELQQAGYQIEPDFWFADEGISGKVASSQRPAFKAMFAQIRKDETLVVSKLDRLGRDSIDVLQTVRRLSERGIRVVVLQLGNTDLTAPAGKLLLSMLAAVAEMERDLLVERTQAGLARAKAEGKRLGRPAKTTPEQRSEILNRLPGENPLALWHAPTGFLGRMSAGSELNGLGSIFRWHNASVTLILASVRCAFAVYLDGLPTPAWTA
jgi:DNA invertase Pin-like site-specific DNA recombinase